MEAIEKAAAEIRALLQGANSYLWVAARRLSEIYFERRWAPAYPSFRAFSEQALGMHEKTARNMARVAREFDEGQVREFGFTRLRILLPLDAEGRQQGIREMRAGATKRDLERTKQRHRSPTCPQGRELLAASDVVGEGRLEATGTRGLRVAVVKVEPDHQVVVTVSGDRVSVRMRKSPRTRAA